ncbi:response regulator, partial [Methylibium sp.]|uniref:response regulator n=1 Tax=Methylibium sp. TaxID=2067992 RepID=UPI0017917524
TAARAQPCLELAFVVIESGRRRKPRRDPADQISLDDGCLHRAVFLRAVALAAGVEPEETAPDRTLPVDTHGVPLDLPSPRAHQVVLVAEDNEVNQKVLLRQLALLGFQVEMASNGAQALACWRRGGHALLLTDLHMPEMDGYDLVTAVRAEERGGPRIPIIAVTANALRDEELRCRMAGMDDYLTKPVRLERLDAAISQWLPRVAPGTAEAAPAPSFSNLSLEDVSTPVDLSVLAELVGDDPQVIREVLLAFRANSVRAAQELASGQSAGLLRAVAETTHKLKSAARSIGALKLAQICADIEEAANAQHAAELGMLMASFEAELLAVHRFLDSH